MAHTIKKDLMNVEEQILPIPTHLQGYLIPVGDENSEYEVTGTMRCFCGGETFKILESNNRHIIKLICDQCGTELLLFDSEKHGWNGFVCNEDAHTDRKLPFVRYDCPKCSHDSYHVTVSVSSQGKEDFLEECVAFDDSFSADDWVDGFECIAVSLSCVGCGFTEEDWMVLETM